VFLADKPINKQVLLFKKRNIREIHRRTDWYVKAFWTIFYSFCMSLRNERETTSERAAGCSNWGSNPGRSKQFFFAKTFIQIMWSKQLPFNPYRRSFSGVEQLELEADHISPSSAKVTNECNYTGTTWACMQITERWSETLTWRLRTGNKCLRHTYWVKSRYFEVNRTEVVSNYRKARTTQIMTI
jgi:hypothetical protein